MQAVGQPRAVARGAAAGSPRGQWRGGRAGRPGGQASRRVRGPAAHRAADRAAACKTLSVCYLPSRAPRWRAGGAARGCEGRSRAPRRWRGGAMGTSRPTAKPHEGFTRQRDTSVGHDEGARAWGTGGAHSGAMGTSRPTATGPHHRTRPGRTAMGHEGATRVRGPSRTGRARVRAARGRSDERRFRQNREGGSHRRMRTRTRDAPRFFAPIKLKNRESRRVDM